MTPADFASLSDRKAIRVAKAVIENWERSAPSKAEALRQKIDSANAELSRREQKIVQPELDMAEAANASRHILSILGSETDSDWPNRIEHGLAAADHAEGQIADPVSVGLILIGLVLAARVKEVGKRGVLFNSGLPEGLSKIAKLVVGL
jgi:hypothetical protein